jgi:hypothetical protein
MRERSCSNVDFAREYFNKMKQKRQTALKTVELVYEGKKSVKRWLFVKRNLKKHIESVHEEKKTFKYRLREERQPKKFIRNIKIP